MGDLGATLACLRADIENRIGWLTFDNPARRNAVTVSMWEAVPIAIERFENDPDVRAIGLRGAGTVAFVSGADVSEFDSKRSDAAALAHYDRIAREAQDRLYDCPKPTIAMIRGFCFGAGVSLAACCDVRIAAEGAQFCIPAGRLGLGYRAAGVKKLVDLMGPARVLDLFYTSARLDARTAMQRSLVEHVVPDDEIETFTRDYCAKIADSAPLTLAAVKRTVRELARAGEAYDRSLCDRMVQQCFESEDYAEGRRAFREKRPPAFRGR